MNLVAATFANHALEHATITLLMKDRDLSMRVAGRALPSGFMVYGEVGADELEEKAQTALERLQRGEHHLAVSPFCGTNIVVTGLLTTAAVGLALTRGRGVSRWAQAVFNGTIAALIAQPVGRLVQQKLTTAPDLLRGAQILNVERLLRPIPTHRISTLLASQ